MPEKPKFEFGKWCVNAILMGIVKTLKLFPFRMRSNIGGWLVRGPLGRLTGYRKRVYKNLQHVWSDKPDTHDKIAQETLDNAGRTFVENFYPKDFQENNTNIEIWGDGLQDLLDASAKGQSIVLVSGHFGNHEALRWGLNKYDMPIGGIYRPMANRYFNKFYLKLIQIEGKSGPLFPVGRKGTRACRQALKDGGVAIVILIDLRVASGEELEFLGKPAMTSTAAAAFAIESNALYVPYFSMRTPDRHGFSVEIAKPIPHTTSTAMTIAATRLLEDRIEKDPGNWFWVHRRWAPWI